MPLLVSISSWRPSWASFIIFIRFYKLTLFIYALKLICFIWVFIFIGIQIISLQSFIILSPILVSLESGCFSFFILFDLIYLIFSLSVLPESYLLNFSKNQHFFILIFSIFTFYFIYFCLHLYYFLYFFVYVLLHSLQLLELNDLLTYF